jgi:hypothetical protein
LYGEYVSCIIDRGGGYETRRAFPVKVDTELTMNKTAPRSSAPFWDLIWQELRVVVVVEREFLGKYSLKCVF